MSRPPAAEVLRAFGAGGEVTPLAGGQGSSWLTADLVLKHEHEGAAHAWLGANFGRIEQRGFRLAEPVPTVAGAWTCQGWTATRFVRGQEPNHRRHPCWVADALCWHDAPASLRRDLQVSTSAVARALLFRLHATHQRVAAGIRPELLEQEIERYAHAVVALGL